MRSPRLALARLAAVGALVLVMFADAASAQVGGNLAQFPPKDLQLEISTSPTGEPVLSVQEFQLVTGEIPSPINPPTGCAFHPRCPVARDSCRELNPELRPVGPGRSVACPYADTSQAAA